jgi:SAM-dependent methyltransferase
MSATHVVPHITALLSPRSVLDLGCGKGEWLEAFGLEDWLGVDIAAPAGDRFLSTDLTERIGLGRTFDLVLCLEVGEHLPEESADTLVDNCVTHANAVVFSAAVLGQEGTGHINCQPHEYWHEKFSARGYVVNDAIRPKIARDPYVSEWYRNNMFLYLRMVGNSYLTDVGRNDDSAPRTLSGGSVRSGQE